MLLFKQKIEFLLLFYKLTFVMLFHIIINTLSKNSKFDFRLIKFKNGIFSMLFMIVIRTPLRISLGGGGTDLPFYANVHGGSLLTATINKYINVSISPRLEKDFKLNYSQTEIVKEVMDIEHPLFREALKLVGISNGVELHSTAELPSGTGLGSSQSFLVGLLHALYRFKGITPSHYMLAEDASHVTMDILEEPCGKQDQYAASFGGVMHLDISPTGKVQVTPLNLTYQTIKRLENNLMLFYTGFRRSAVEVLQSQADQAGKDKKIRKEELFNYYHKIKEIGVQSRGALESGDLRKFGKLLDLHWNFKKGISSKMSNPQINAWYETAKKHGALGGKLIGAGGGGFLMVYVEEFHERMKLSLEKEGLIYTPFSFDFGGSVEAYNGLK